MIYRLLGRLFFLFWICPSIARTAKYLAPKVNVMLCDAIRDITQDDEAERTKSRRNHPAGSRLS